MVKKRRSRPPRMWGTSSLSALCMSCGVMFIVGNIYILHSGFSQAYSNLELENAEILLQQQQQQQQQQAIDTYWSEGSNTMHHTAIEEGMIMKDLPVIALTAFGYQHPKDRAFQSPQGERDAVEYPNQRPSPVVLLGGGGSDTRLRKLMENRREVLQAEEEGLGGPASNPLIIGGIGNTGRKQRTKGGMEIKANLPTRLSHPDTARVLQGPVLHYKPHSDHHLYSSNKIMNNNDDKKQFKDSSRVFDSAHKKDKSHGEEEFAAESFAPPNGVEIADIPVSNLRQLLGHGSQCGLVRNLTGREYISSGWTKAVHRALLHRPGTGDAPEVVAVKTVDMTGHDVTSCIKGSHRSLEYCYNRASQKLMKEIVLLRTFNSPHIIKKLGYCVPEKPYDGAADGLVSMVTEIGETIDIIKLLQMSWEDRLRVSYGLTKLLQYLAKSPFGTVSLNDFRRQQFILVNNDIVLTDVDDVGVGEPTCQSETDCLHYFSSANFTLRAPCVSGRCQGFNEKKNIFNAARHFTTFLLPHGAPPSLKPALNQIVHAFSNATLRAETLLQLLDEVVEKYRSGKYSTRSSGDNITKYQVDADSDLPGLYDYRCRYSIATVGCTLSVLDQREAEHLCDLEPDCRGFVISNKRTWAGRMLVHLKNNVSTEAVPSPGLTLCRKPI